MKYFGTDGFRGEANISLKNHHAYKIGRFLGWYFSNGEKPARIVIGKDTRRSSYMLEYSLATGISASGGEAYLMHVTTTPSVAYITRVDDFHSGIMISASHNEFFDNGIKLFAENGEKFGEEILEKIESYIDGDYSSLGRTQDIPLAKREKIGKISDYFCGRNKYMAYLLSLATHSYKGVKVGLDMANGSAYSIARSVFESLGAKVFKIADTPDGTNININCGSTHPKALQQLVKENHLDIGFAFDGDADRCIAVDENGKLISGDEILYIYAKFLKECGGLGSGTVATTEMSNLGLYIALEELGIGYSKTKVGDRYVYEDMVENSRELGGEPSGHIIFRKYATTGDGILTAMKMMQVMLERKTPLSALASQVKMLPQCQINVCVADKEKTMCDPDVAFLSEKIKRELGRSGRLLLRKSGTENLVRILVESDCETKCEKLACEMRNIIMAKEMEND